MKKVFYSLLALAAITSCAKTSEVQSEGIEIKLAPITKMQTKANFLGAVDGNAYPTAENFDVYAYWKDIEAGQMFTDGLIYFQSNDAQNSGAEFTNKGEYWGGVETYFWPKVGSLRFAAYSPSHLNVAHSLAEDTYSISNFVQPTETDKTFDFLVAPTTPSYSMMTEAEKVTLDFKHALSWITLKVKAANADAAKAFTIHDLIINDVFTNADLEADMTDGVQYDEWKNADVKAAYNVVLDGDINTTTIARVAENVENGTVVIPQVPTTLTINFTQNEMKEDNGETATPELKEQTLTIPLELNNEEDNKWHPGKHYIYTIVFDLEEIVINPSVADWEDVIVDEKDDNDDGYINTAATEEQLM